MKKNFLLIIFGITIINFVLFYKVMITVVWEKANLTTGSLLGDTINGLLSPILGLISIFLIYKTFQEQKTTNQLQEKLSNFSAFSEMLNKCEGSLSNIEYKGEKGSNAIDKFTERLYQIGGDNEHGIVLNSIGMPKVYENTSSDDKEIVQKTIDILGEITFLFKYLNKLNLLPEHKETLNRKLEDILNEYFKTNYIVIKHTLSSLHGIPDDNHPPFKSNLKQRGDVNFFIRRMDSFFKLIYELISMNKIAVEENNLSFEEAINFPIERELYSRIPFNKNLQILPLARPRL